MDADLAGAFDNIDHDNLLKTIGEFPARGMIAGWLQGGCSKQARASRRPRRELHKAA